MVSFSVIIVTHGREDLLIKCLDSLKPQSVTWQLILVANGKNLPQDILTKANSLTAFVTLIETDQKVRPGKARNLALEKVEAEWIYFIDDDAFVLPGYWEIALPFLSDSSIDVLGGPDSPAKGMNKFSNALALALSSPFCTGTTFFRHKPYGSKLQYADEEKLTSCNLWVRKSALKGLLFPEDYVRAEENQFLQKLSASGRRLFYHPKLLVAHFRRTKISELWRPTFYAGFSRSRLLKENIKKGNQAFWLPSFFVLLHILIFIEPMTFWYLARMYVGIILFASLAISMRVNRSSLFFLVAFFHYYIVFIYGIGFLAERLGYKK